MSHVKTGLATLALLPALLLLGSGCAIGPDYKQPDLQTPATWREPAPPDAPTIANLPWWEIYRDEPHLLALIRESLENNKEIKIALERLAQSHAARGLSNAAYLPAIGYNATAYRSDPARLATTNAPGFTAAASVSWELDLWGRVRRLNESATAAYFATAEAKNAVVLTLVADVATTYFNLRMLDEQTTIAEQTAATREDAHKIALARLDKGIGNAIDALQFEADALAARTAILTYKQNTTHLENALSLLLGRPPGPIARPTPGDPKTKPTRPLEIPPGLPADLLRNRPDLRAAERNLCAANAQIGAAIANYFPKISLTGVLGFASPQLKGLFDHGGSQGGGSLLGPLFDGFATYHTVKAAESRYRETLHAYEQATLNALREVNDALADHAATRQRHQLLRQQVAALADALQKTRASYDAGRLALLPVLDADRTHFNARLALISTQNDLLAAQIRLYKALGGGWSTPVAYTKTSDGSPPGPSPILDARGVPHFPRVSAPAAAAAPAAK